MSKQRYCRLKSELAPFNHFEHILAPSSLLTVCNKFPLYIGIIVALKRKRAAVSAECSDVLSKLKDLKKTT